MHQNYIKGARKQVNINTYCPIKADFSTTSLGEVGASELHRPTSESMPKSDLDIVRTTFLSQLSFDAQGSVSAEEFLFATARTLLEVEFPSLSEKFGSRFEDLIGSGDDPLSVDEAFKKTVEELAQSEEVSSPEAETIMKRISAVTALFESRAESLPGGNKQLGGSQVLELLSGAFQGR